MQALFDCFVVDRKGLTKREMSNAKVPHSWREMLSDDFDGRKSAGLDVYKVPHPLAELQGRMKAIVEAMQEDGARKIQEDWSLNVRRTLLGALEEAAIVNTIHAVTKGSVFSASVAVATLDSKTSSANDKLMVAAVVKVFEEDPYKVEGEDRSDEYKEMKSDDGPEWMLSRVLMAC